MNISDIVVGNRHRQDLGDIAALADSIKKLGLLQPIGVTPENELVFGLRRLVACRDHLGMAEIDHRVVNVTDIVSGEFAENEMRKAFTISERVAIFRTIQTIKAGPREFISAERNSLPTKKEAAKRVGFSGPATAWRAEQLVDHAPDLLEKVERGEMALFKAFTMADEKGLIKRAGPKQTRNKRRAQSPAPVAPVIMPRVNLTKLDIGTERIHGQPVQLEPVYVQRLREAQIRVQATASRIQVAAQLDPESFVDDVARMQAHVPVSDKTNGEQMNFAKIADNWEKIAEDYIDEAINRLSALRRLLKKKEAA